MIQWSTPITNHIISGEDHLGIESPAQTYQGYLLAGIITTTSRVRYFSFYSWVLHHFIQRHEHDLSREAFEAFIQRYELAFILGCYHHHRASDEHLAGLVGGGPSNGKARQFWDAAEQAVDLTTSYLSPSLGGLGQPYGSVTREMGVMGEAKRGNIPTLTTQTGKTLAKAFEKTIQGTTFFEHVTHDTLVSDALLKGILAKLGETACLCPASLADGHDREPLRDMLFRFGDDDQTIDERSVHYARRFSLGLLLDFAKQGNGQYDIAHPQTMRRLLYLHTYDADTLYTPASALNTWHFHWNMVMMRQMYTSALQCLFHAFLQWLHNPTREAPATFEQWLTTLGTEPALTHLMALPIENYLSQIGSEVGMSDWRADHFADPCTVETGKDELALFDDLLDQLPDVSVGDLVVRGLRLLCQITLRYRSTQDHELWQRFHQQAGTIRLPLKAFVNALLADADSGQSVREVLARLFRRYIIGQHEVIALRKLRQQNYNTFCFTHRDGVFYPDSEEQQPLRYPSLRLYNGIQMLIDVGLLATSSTGTVLTGDGQQYLNRVLESAHS